MIDRILKAGKDEDWILATKLLYEHWTENCPKVFIEKSDNPWINTLDEARVYDELIRPVASLYIGREIKSSEYENNEDRGCSLEELANEYGCNVENNSKGQICGKGFGNGELTYHCKDCEVDGTCVLCKDCFEKSEHRNHNHKVSVSIGGGYCDCGDSEAWKNDFACSDHQPIEEDNGTDSQSSSSHPQIPPQIESRIKQLTLSVILYSISVLYSDGDEKLSNLLNLSGKSKFQNNFQAVLYNDETHTYENVIKALVNAINVNEDTACKIATIIDKQGRATVKIGTKSDCEKVKQVIIKRTNRENSTNKGKKDGPLEVKVLSSVTVAVQEFAFFLLKWLNKQMTIFTPLQNIVADICLNRYCNPDNTIDNLCSAPTLTKDSIDGYDDDDDVQPMEIGNEKNESLRIIDTITDDVQNFFDILTKPHDDGPKSAAELARQRCSNRRKKDKGDIIIALMIKANIKWWKSVRLTTQSFIMTALVRRLDYKIQFSKILITHYKKLLKDYCLDDHHQLVSVLSLTVQYFTVPTVAKAIIAGDNAFSICMQTIIKLMNAYLKKSKYNQALDVYDFQDGAYGKHPFYVKRLSTILVDVQYLLQSVPSPDEWTPELREGFLNGVDHLFQFFGYIQDMNQTRRHYGEHQVWEMEWETAFYLQLYLQNIAPLVIDWALSDFEVYKEVFKRVYDKIKDLINKHPDMTGSKKEITINGITASCIDFDINNKPISIHQPLWRIFAGLFTANNNTFLNNIKTNASGIRLEWEPSPYRMHLDLAIMAEPPLRCIIFLNQVTLGMWRKNGFGVVNQCHNYNSSNCRGEMFDRDIILLQATAALTDPDQFIIRMIHRYGLHNWADLNFDYDVLKANHEALLASEFGSINSNDDAITRIPNSRARFLRTAVVGTDFRMETVFGHTNQTPPNQSPLLEDSSKHLTGLAEEMLNLIIYLICERYVKGVGKVTLQDILEREIIHMLSINPLPFSKIEKITNWGDFTEELLQNALKSVATYSHPEKSVPGIFTLKDEIKPYFSPYFYHYTKSEASKAEQTQKDSRKNLDLELRCCPPHNLPEFDEFYKNVPSLLKCTIFVTLQKAILERYINKSRFSSEGLVNRICYTICLALNEQKRHDKPDTYDYLSIGDSYDILKLLKGALASSPLSNCCDMITYTIQKYEEVSAWYFGKEIVKAKVNENKDSQEEVEKANKRAEKARRLREQAMKKMMNKASNFMKNASSTENTKSGDGPSTSQRTKLLSVMDDDEETGEIINDKGFPVCLGSHKSEILPIEKKQALCILCQDTERLKFGKTGFVCCAYAYKSFLFTQKDYTGLRNTNNLDIFVDASIPESLAVMTCGHTIHYQCFKNFKESYKSRNSQRMTNSQSSKIIDIDGGEYLCPLCKRISNCAIPYLPHQDFSGITKVSTHTLQTKNEDFSTWLSRYRRAVEGRLDRIPSGIVKPQPHKGHSRKRSHSERSLLELAKQGDEPFIDNNLSSTPTVKCASEASLPMNTEIGSGMGDMSSSDGFRSPTNIGSMDSSFFDTVSPKNLLSNIKHMKKAYFYKNKKETTPKIMRDTEMMYVFVNTMAEFKKDSPTSKDQAQKYLKICNVWHTCVFILRQVAAVLEEENKPLFGALNFRQKESLKCLTRIATSSSNFISSINSRSLATILLQPLLYPLNNVIDSNKSMKEDKISPFPVLSKFHVSLMQRANSVSSDDSNSQRSRDVKSPDHGNKLFSNITTPFFKDMGQETLSAKAANRFKKQDSLLSIDCLTLAFDLLMVIGHTSINGEVYLHDKFKDDTCNLVVDGSQDELNVIQLVLYAHIFQILATFENDDNDDSDMPLQDETYLRIMDIVNAIGKDDKQFVKNIEQNFNKVKERIIKGILGYLRPLAIFYRILTLVPPPEVLKDPGFDQLSPLLRYMGLPSSLEELFSVEGILPLYEMWGKQLPNKFNGSNNHFYVKQPISINKLIDLPQDFTDIIVEASKFRCPSSSRVDNVSSNPSLCLVCGKILCAQSMCCQSKVNKNEEIGAGNLHMQNCSGQNGLFLRMRECIILAVTTKNRGASYNGPYVDKYGEQDGGNKRGNRLFFSDHLYSKFRKAWLHQDVVEMIINENEVNHRLAVYEWRQF